MNDKDMWLERVSALADGQLDGPEFDDALQALASHDDLRASWRTYHVVGDVLRNGRHTPCRDSAAFMASFHARLEAEDALAPVAAVSASRLTHEAANEPVFRWKLVAGAASLAAVAAISWNWIGSGAGAGAPQLAQGAPAAVVVANKAPVAPAQALTASRVTIGAGAAPQVMLRDPRLDALLEAHQQAAGVSQMPAGFLRNATFEGPSR